jgi:hypothetical protein
VGRATGRASRTRWLCPPYNLKHFDTKRQAGVINQALDQSRCIAAPGVQIPAWNVRRIAQQAIAHSEIIRRVEP